MTANILSWIFGIGAMVSLFSIYQQTSRRNLLLCKLSADVCWSIHYLCLGAFGGAIPNFVGIFRELVFVNRERKKWAALPIWPILFIAINLSLGIRTFQNPINIMPITASIFVTISLWLRKPILTKLISFPVSVTFLIYDILIGSWIGTFNESIALISLLISVFRERINSKKEENKEKEGV